MARRRKKSAQSVPLIFVVVTLTALILITEADPWQLVRILMIFVVISLFGFGLYIFWKNRLRHAPEKMHRLLRAAQTRTVVEMSFLNPTEFEHHVATLYEQLGYAVTVTKQSGDGGIDLILQSKNNTAAVQVKKYTGGVGRPELQKLIGASLGKYDRMIFVTTSYFSPQATEYATEHNIELIDGNELESMGRNIFGQNYIQRALFSNILSRK